MDSIVVQQRLVSAYTVCAGPSGQVCRYAQERGVSRQWVYREAHWVTATLQGTATQEEIARLRSRVRDLEQQQAVLEQRLAQAVVIDDDKQAELAAVAQVLGISLPACQAWLDVLIAGRAPSVAWLVGDRAGG